MELTPPPHSFVTFWYRFSLKIAHLEIVVISVSIGGKSRIRPIVQRRAQPPNPTHFSNAQSRPSCLTNGSVVINDERTETEFEFANRLRQLLEIYETSLLKILKLKNTQKSECGKSEPSENTEKK